MKKNSTLIFKKVFSVTVIILIAKLLGFIKQMITAGIYGATIETDLINLSQNLIGNIEYVLRQVFITSFIPIYIQVKNSDEAYGNKYISKIFKLWTIISICIMLLFALTAPVLSRIIAPTYSAELSYRLTKYIRYFCPALIMLVYATVFNSILRANQHFNEGEFSSVIQSVVIIFLSLAIGKTKGPVVLAIGYYVYLIINFIYLSISSRPYWSADIKIDVAIDNEVKKQIKMAGPLFLGYAMVFINQEVDAIIVSGIGEGAVTALGYAAVLLNLVVTLIGSVSSVFFTYISQYIAEEKEKQVADLIIKANRICTAVLIPISIIFIVNAREIITIIFARGAFSHQAVAFATNALIGYAFSIPFLSSKELFSRFQYGYMDSKQPMINTAISIISNIFLSIVLSHYIGIFGVTLATSISTMISGILNMLMSKRHNKYLVNILEFRDVFSAIISACFCIFVSFWLREFIPSSYHFIRVLVTASISLLINILMFWRYVVQGIHMLKMVKMKR